MNSTLSSDSSLLVDQLAEKLATYTKPALAKAYVKFWGDVQNVVKDATNPHFKNRYATLEAALNVVKPALAANGLALLQMPGPVKGDVVSLTTTLVHSSGEAWTFATELPMGAKATAQAVGSCITYARRYAVMALAGIAATDEDGNEASGINDGSSDDEGRTIGVLRAAIAAIKPTHGKKLEAVTALELLKDEVKKAGDKGLADEYIAKRAEIKGSQ